MQYLDTSALLKRYIEEPVTASDVSTSWARTTTGSPPAIPWSRSDGT